MLGDAGVGPEDLKRSQAEASLRYRRLRAPADHGGVLQIPSLNETIARWEDGKLQPNNGVDDLQGTNLTTLRQQGRNEVLQQAAEYTRRYRDVDLSGRDACSVIMSGHQPHLFHAGVWFKNFALSTLGAAVNAMPVNLVVDNDVSGPASIKCPAFFDRKASTRLIEIDGVHAAVPYECRPIVDDDVFGSFAKRASAALAECAAACGQTVDPLVSRLWEHVKAVRGSLDGSSSLGTVLAAARHRLEQDSGLQTLEVPVSWMAQTGTFAQVASMVIQQQARFNESYNARLVEYRQVHKIRSNAHPVPSLEETDGWLESPFWVWSQTDPQRRRLFVRTTGKTVRLTDRAGWELQTESGDLASTWLELADQQIALRPRALLTTMYSRLVLSDQFLHGIGGAKYDQLTDLIASDFFGVTLPPFLTVTATMHLPLAIPSLTQADRSRIQQQIRQHRFHPERFIDSDQAADRVEQKRKAISNLELTPLQRQHAISEANLNLQPFVSKQVESLRQSLAGVEDQIHNSRILNSREYSFCLFPESLVDDLKTMASM